MVQAQRTFSNPLEPQQRSESKVCRGLPQEVGVVRLYRTFSNYSFTGETRCAGCSCTSSRWFKLSEPPRTFSNHSIAELERCVVFFHRSSGWFDCTKPSLPTSIQGKQGLQGCTCSGWFKRIESPRSFSNHLRAELAGRVAFLH